jgi:HEAT repeat protein
MARYGLEPIPDPAVDDALRAALGKVKGRTLAGVIGSIGVRRDAKATDALAALLQDPDEDVAQAAARSLGRIATPAAAQALQAGLAATKPANRPAFCEGLLRCADAFQAKGNNDQAAAIHEALRKFPDTPAPVRAALAAP